MSFAVKTNTPDVVLVSNHPFDCSNLKTKLCIRVAKDVDRTSDGVVE
jgi:hypothetical protein